MDWTEILIKIAEVCLVPILGILTNYIIIFVKAKCTELAQKANNDKIVKYIDLFNQMICDCVIATNQTYVDALKAQGAFDLEAQKIAFNKTKEAIFGMLTDDMKLVLEEVYGDLSLFIQTKIESEVNFNK